MPSQKKEIKMTPDQVKRCSNSFTIKCRLRVSMSFLTYWLWREARFYVVEMRAKFDTLYRRSGNLYQSHNLNALFTGDIAVHKIDQSLCPCGAFFLLRERQMISLKILVNATQEKNRAGYRQ